MTKSSTAQHSTAWEKEKKRQNNESRDTHFFDSNGAHTKVITPSHKSLNHTQTANKVHVAFYFTYFIASILNRTHSLRTVLQSIALKSSAQHCTQPGQACR